MYFTRECSKKCLGTGTYLVHRLQPSTIAQHFLLLFRVVVGLLIYSFTCRPETIINFIHLGLSQNFVNNSLKDSNKEVALSGKPIIQFIQEFPEVS